MGYIFPFAFASVLAIALQRPVRFISRKLHLKAHGIVSLILVLLIVSIVVGILFLIGKKIVEEVSDLIMSVVNRYDSLAEFLADVRGYADSLIAKLPAAAQTKATETMDNLMNKVSSGEGVEIDLSMLSGPLAGAWNVVKEIPSVLVTILVTIISCVFMTAEYDIIRDMILSFFTEEKGKKIVEAKRVVSKGVGKLLKAYLTIMLITFTEVFLGLNLMKLIGIYEGGYIAIIAFVVCIVDIVPVLGTGTVVIPWAIYSFVTGNVGLGIGLAILYVVITVLRQAIEPKLVASQVGLPSIVTIMAMFLGARLFGLFGVVLLPFTVIVIKLMLDEGIIGSRKLIKEFDHKTESDKEAAE
jgi:sporulation integral membrane protein YtvI